MPKFEVINQDSGSAQIVFCERDNLELELTNLFGPGHFDSTPESNPDPDCEGCVASFEPYCNGYEYYIIYTLPN